VLLHFWTGSCVNCVHVLAELRDQVPDGLPVVGVHSPKFPHEAEPGAVETAAARLEVGHPVLDDADRTTWSAYAVRAWPTLVLVDADGYVVASRSGEGHVAELVALAGDLPPAAPGTPRATDGGPLRFPARIARTLGGELLVVDAGHHRLLVGERPVGSGERGHVDGLDPSFAAPQGIAVLPADLAARLGYDVVVADTGNHLLRGVRLADGATTTLAGTGRQARTRSGGGEALATDLSSPWDVVWWPAFGEFVVAMAGTHQLWAFDPFAATVRVIAGTTAEGLLDGPAERAWLAQPSALVVDGDRLWFVDAETSAVRWLSFPGGLDRSVPCTEDPRMANVDPVARPGGVVGTAVGGGLFEFGAEDGPAARARFQHPLGAALDAGTVLVADTFNGALRRYDPLTGTVTTLLDGLDEPVGVLREGDDLLVVESAAHRVDRWTLPAPDRAELPAVRLRTGAELRVEFVPPPGRHLDDRWGSPYRVQVEGAGGDGSEIRFQGSGVLSVLVRVATCDDGAGTCRLEEFTRLLPFTTAADGEAELVLRLP
jgi:thiol-disulfide isomerase/thioredoxin